MQVEVSDTDACTQEYRSVENQSIALQEIDIFEMPPRYPRTAFVI